MYQVSAVELWLGVVIAFGIGAFVGYLLRATEPVAQDQRPKIFRKSKRSKRLALPGRSQEEVDTDVFIKQLRDTEGDNRGLRLYRPKLVGNKPRVPIAATASTVADRMDRIKAGMKVHGM